MPASPIPPADLSNSRPPSGPAAPRTASPRRRWGVSFLGAAALAGAGWLLGPVAGLDAPLPRAVPALPALGAWVLLNRRIDARERAANARLVEALAASRDPELKASLDELGVVRGGLDAVLDRLKTLRFSARLGGRYLYQIPWYLVIGAPGSGKTTALSRARLGAPLAPAAGQGHGQMAGGGLGQPLHGLGGTRNADWWFTDHAVLIDTAGRYTTQDSRRPVDNRVWAGLLELLKAHRPRQPVNGVLATVSLSDLTGWSDAERRDHAITLRQRLLELRGRLGLRVPVYLMLTKADLLEGFDSFFDTLDRRERAQVWGLTFPPEQDARGLPGAFRARFADLLRRLDERLPERLHQEPDIRRRSETFAFPLRVAELEGPLADLVDTVFGSEAGEEAPLLRGIYFSSATQPGRTAEDPAPTYFLERLLPELVFPEANLAGEDRALERRRRRRRMLAAGGAVAAGLAVALAWLGAWRAERARLEEAAAGIGQVTEALRALDSAPRSLTRVEDTDFAAVLPALDGLRALAAGDGARPLFLSAGLDQGARLARPAAEVYHRALRTILLSRVVLRLEEQLRTGWAVPAQLRSALRAYRMVGGREPVDRTFLADWMAEDWLQILPDTGLEAAHRALGAHLATLLEVGFAPVPLDERLAGRVAELLNQTPDGRNPEDPESSGGGGTP
ncbi:type VI secretion system membrane subunit TssM [Azospirillum sp. SYSU D00513]|uniref:type VI secretion system membrane subunit TssM n=1 Tax=Azospirillum sp. SYSU D00513 TaxID=2812561 RepID=UPI001A95BFAC|nr:type VI secretion system membrane subunit TssM [Azospirillum sp. SYSU D00513]